MAKPATNIKSDQNEFHPKNFSLIELFDMFSDDKTAMAWFEGNIWSDGRKCPRCDSKDTHATKHPHVPYYCSGCKKYFSVKIGTVMEISKIGYRKWAIATHRVANNPREYQVCNCTVT